MNDIRQEDMAEKLNISRATLINYEKNHTTINVDVLDRLKTNFPDFETEINNNIKPKMIEDNVINFSVIFSVLSSNKKNIIFSIIIFSIFGLGISFFFTKYYSSKISLYPAKKDTMQNLGQFQSLASNFGFNMPENTQSFHIPDVVKSRLIANKVLSNKWLSKDGINISLYKLWEMDQPSWLNLIKKAEIDSSYMNEKAISKFNKHVDVLQDRLTGLITITTRFKDPSISARIANYIGYQVQSYIQKENSAQSTREKQFISDRLSIVKSELESSEILLKDFKERNRGYDESPELFMIFSRIFREVEAKKQLYLTLEQQLELARIDEVKQSPILHILDHAVESSRKSSPNRLMFLVIFFFSGLFLSSLLAIFKY